MMKKCVSLLVMLCMCIALAACAFSASAESATPAPAATEKPAAATAAPSAAPADALDLDAIVTELNEKEEAKNKDTTPYVGRYQISTEKNKLWYKIAIDRFSAMIFGALSDDADKHEKGLMVFNSMVETLAPVQIRMEEGLRETYPELSMDIVIMGDEYAKTVAAVISDGEIVYDLVNGIGEAPEGVEPIFVKEDTPAS